jgi:Lrp/AsnC family leucine-responsive transcriptional regulator
MPLAMSLDATDRLIIEELRRNARATLGVIGQSAGLSPSAVARRIDRLETSGVIRGYTAIVDEAHAGRPLEAFTELTFAGDTKVSDISAVAKGLSEVEAVFTTAGDPDALVWIRVRDVAHLAAVIDRLRRDGNVSSTKTLMVLDTWRAGMAVESGR